MATANVTLAHTRFYADDSSDADAGTALAAEDANLSRGEGTANRFWVRLCINNDNSANFNSAIQLQFRKNGGTWTDVTASTANAVAVTGGLPTDGATLASSLLSGTGTFNGGTYDEGDGSAPADAIAKDNFGEWEWCVYLVDAQLAVSDTVEFRHTSGATDNWPGTFPVVTVVSASITVTPDTAVAASVALDVVVALGAVTVTPDEAVAAAVALDVTVDAPTTVVPDEAVAASVALDVVVALGAVTVTPDEALAASVALDVGVALGAVTVVPDEAVVVAVALDVAADAPTTVVPDVAVAAATALEVGVALGAVTVTPDPAVVASVALDVDLALGTVTVTPDTAETAAIALDVSVQLSGGAITVTPDVAVVASVALDVGVALGAVSVSVDEAVVVAVALDVAADAPTTVVPDVALVWAEALDVGVALGAVVVTPDEAVVAAVALDVGVALGPVSVSVDVAVVAAVALDVLLPSGGPAVFDVAVVQAVALDVRLGRRGWPDPDTGGPGEWDGLDVLNTTTPNLRDGIAESFSRLGAMLDGGTGRRRWDDWAGVPMARRSFDWFACGRSEITALRTFLEARKGRVVPFWVPTFLADLEMTADAGFAESAITVRQVGYGEHLFQHNARKSLALVMPGGTFIAKKVTLVIDNLDGTETLTLDSGLGFDLAAETTMVSYLVLCRLDLDSTLFQWFSPEMAEANITFREIAPEVPA